MSASRPKRKKRPTRSHLPADLGMNDPGDWVMTGGAWPEANQAYGFKERQAAQAAVTAYVETFMAAEDQAVSVERADLIAVMVAQFQAELEGMTSR